MFWTDKRLTMAVGQLSWIISNLASFILLRDGSHLKLIVAVKEGYNLESKDFN